ncbi:MAG: LysM peptidoglycan-binding domain-containing protein, partial [FCB group bacterium]|nr:LysM peptidoglycan-binding domain-containing protein [FCB group bacterium]
LANFNALPENQRFAPQYIVHRVRRGESLWSIAKKYNISIHDLASVNKIRNRHKIRVGQKLTVPIRGASSRTLYAGAQGPSGHVKVVYTVKKGDTLGHIAEGYRTRASKIRRWNGLKYGEYIYPGQKLVVWVKEG